MSDEAFRAEARAFFEGEFPEEFKFLPRRMRWSECRDWYLKLSKKGWIAPNWPREHGGMGLSPSKLLIYFEETERAGVGRMPDQGITMVGPTLIRFGNDAQRARYLPKIIAGDAIWCQGYSEPNAGSDLASLRTEALPDGDDYVINGSKIWTSMAHDATNIYVLARTDRQAKKKQEGISFFLVDMKTPGITLRTIRNIAGHEEFCQVFFDNVRTPKENLVGELHKGWTIAKGLLGFERLNIGSPRRPLQALRKTGNARAGARPAHRSGFCRTLHPTETGSGRPRFAVRPLCRQGAAGRSHGAGCFDIEGLVDGHLPAFVGAADGCRR